MCRSVIQVGYIICEFHFRIVKEKLKNILYRMRILGVAGLKTSRSDDF